MVSEESAMLGSPLETRHSCDSNHSEMAKLDRHTSTDYRVILSFIQESLDPLELSGKNETRKGMRACIKIGIAMLTEVS